MEQLKNLPLIRQWRQRKYDRRFLSNRDANLFRGLYDSFGSAAAALPGQDARGYDQPAAADMYRDMLGQIRDHDYPVLYWLSRIGNPLQSVFDLGGHFGLLYYGLHSHLSLSETFRWWVKDVPAVNAAGRAMAAELGARALGFADTLTAANGCQVMICSGSLQYIERDLPDLLGELDACPSHLLINWLPLCERGGFFTVNSIGTAFCPYKVPGQKMFVQSLQAAGWELVDQWKNQGKYCHVPFQTHFPDAGYYGFYFRRSQSPHR